MKQQLEEEAKLRRYLLGELAPEERVAVEARLFLDDEYLSQLGDVEDELVDNYAHDELAPGEREKLAASNLLSEPERREDLLLAQDLRRYISREVVTPAVVPDTEPDTERWVAINRQYAEQWPNITRKGEPPADADDWKEVPEKFERFFSPNPGVS